MSDNISTNETTKNDSITVYGATWCGDCRRSKKFLEQNQVAFTWIDVEADETARETMQKYNGGVQSIPTIIFGDGTVLVEPTNAQLGHKIGL